MRQSIYSRLTKALWVVTGVLALSACASTPPSVKTTVEVTSRLAVGMNAAATENLRPVPDWGQTVAVIPAKGVRKDATYEAIKKAIENKLFAAKLETVPQNGREDYRMTVAWSLKPSRVIKEVEQIPVTVHMPVYYHGGWGGYPHHYGPWAGMGMHMAPHTAWIEQVKTVQLYARTLTLRLYEGKDNKPVYRATVMHEARCNQYGDIVPYLVDSAIDNLYTANGTVKIDTLPLTTEVCR